MKNRQHIIFTIILVILIFFVSVNFNVVKAAGATLSVSKQTVAPGETFELYVNLSVQSIAYDIRVSETGDGIANKLLTNKVQNGEGDASRFWLIQVTADPTIHPIGSKIATIKYTLSDTAKVGDKITINVTGDIVGRNSDERNRMEESITITVGEKETEEVAPTEITVAPSSVIITQGDTKTITATVSPSGASQEVTWKSKDTSIVTVEDGKITAVGTGTTTIIVTTKDGKVSKEIPVTVNPKENNSDDNANNNENNNQQSSTTGQKDDSTTANKPIPQAGENIVIILIGIALLVTGIVVLVRYKRIK